MDINKIIESVNYIKQKISYSPEVGIILGSGLGELADKVEEKTIIKYEEIPNMPVSTVKGHAGQLVLGIFNGKKVVMMQGRFHYYEGNKMKDVVMPIYIMKYLGIKNIIVTNAAGGVNKNYTPGDLMIIKDHINLSFNNPLIGKNCDELGPRFPDMSQSYSNELIKLAEYVAIENKIKIQKGVYTMMTGPTYETPAEINMVRILGGDAVGMSTVPEVIAANHCGIKVLGISCITNMAAGILDKPLNHKEVIETSNKVKGKFALLISNIIKKI
ncbi:purine nucleoside phosphorylase 1 [Clostridium acetireducens DSM 10703]|jgi:purine-nucleoside phosphorylase|uniref:Purine nucleoside phosphorylase n=1 Tax=Clostridium acetireducens DSM 10703 TaxID=1121290 RepID=A0A1E8F1U6_9CLOT|nr:purine-nucleoside phosphorylase [Clostridium acetireducens]OFI07613.1 purine nucleoside phosphorylase 1 [Clostridium acetireducens DSM 10703]